VLTFYYLNGANFDFVHLKAGLNKQITHVAILQQRCSAKFHKQMLRKQSRSTCLFLCSKLKNYSKSPGHVK